jgi:hypothetical protein
VENPNENRVGEFRSPSGTFIFGVQGWTWGEQRPSAITFFLNGTVRVSDQHGRPVKGAVVDGAGVYFDRCTHRQVIEALTRERIDWTMLTCAGWPQLTYDELSKLSPEAVARVLPPPGSTPQEREEYVRQLRQIKDTGLRRDALRMRREMDGERAKELEAADEE